jgi:hypothetical protein
VTCEARQQAWNVLGRSQAAVATKQCWLLQQLWALAVTRDSMTCASCACGLQAACWSSVATRHISAELAEQSVKHLFYIEMVAGMQILAVR